MIVKMAIKTLSRWQQFYLDDPELQNIPPSACAHQAARIFAENRSQTILDLGCGTGRDSVHLANCGAHVVGLDAARSGLSMAQQRVATSQPRISWVESDSRLLPFPDAAFDGVYCFGLLHEFVDESAENDICSTMAEIHRVLQPSGAAIVAVVAGESGQGLPHVQLFSEAMFDIAASKFHCVEKRLFDDLGCTGRTDYKVWFGHFTKR